MMGKSFVTVKTFETLLDARCLRRKLLIYKGNMAVFSVFRRPPYKSRKTSYKKEYLLICGGGCLIVYKIAAALMERGVGVMSENVDIPSKRIYLRDWSELEPL